MESLDVRWVQSYNDYSKAVEQLTQFMSKEKLNDFEKQGLIQVLEYSMTSFFVLSALMLWPLQ